MDQRSDDIRQDIESTRSSLDDKLSLLENRVQDATDKARETFDVKHQVNERPWVMLGASVLAGYVLGSLGGSSSSSSGASYSSSAQPMYYQTGGSQHSGPSTTDQIKQRGGDFLSQFDDEINMIKTAAVTALVGYVRDAVKEAVPALGDQIEKIAGNVSNKAGGGELSSSSYGGSASSRPTSAPNTSFSSAENSGSADYDSIGQMSRVGSPPKAPASGEEYYETYEPEQNDKKTNDPNNSYAI